ncbi:MAG: nucleoside deaminase [Ruminococcus sp.]|nr:nucleoside deaminase [Ruminococcus sp.]
MDKTDYMREALKLAQEAFDDGEVPVGAVIVKDGDIIAVGRNRREKAKNALLHAEIDAINNACTALGGWRLWNCEIYVTLEPCPMCAGAILNAHIPQVYFGAYDFKNGSCGTITNLFEMPYNFKPAYEGGILQEECAGILKQFFKKLR